MTSANWKKVMSGFIDAILCELRPSAPKKTRLALATLQGRLNVRSLKARKLFEQELEAYIQSNPHVRTAAHRHLARVVPPAIESAIKVMKSAMLVLQDLQKKTEPNSLHEKRPTSVLKSLPKRGAKARSAKLLAGGNPQIAKADGDAPVQTYIAAMPGWKRDIGKRLDALVARNVPTVRKAVKWNSPFYGIEGQGWFLGFHVFTHYVKVTFFRGTSLRPVPSGGTGKDARWIDIHEDDLDEVRMAVWIRQAAALPGWGKS